MDETLQFLQERDYFHSWIESENTTAEDLERYAQTGKVPVKKSTKPRDFNLPPPGTFFEGSIWFHPVSYQKFVYKGGAWEAEPISFSSEDVRLAAKEKGIHSYYNSVTHQFVFSNFLRGESLTVPLEVIKDLKHRSDLDDFLSSLFSSEI